MAASSPDPSNPRGARPAAYALVAMLATVVFAAISWAPAHPKYRWSVLFLTPIVWAPLALRRRLALRLAHYAAFAGALVLHDLGAFGGYSRELLGLQFDWCVHFVFGVVGGLVLARALRLRLGLSGAPRVLLAVLSVAGLGALHEVVEAASTLFLGDLGMLYIGADNPYDSQEDLLAGCLGASAGVALPDRAPDR